MSMPDADAPVAGPEHGLELADVAPDHVHAMGENLRRFVVEYQFGLREVETKIDILCDEFTHMYDPNPIEHVTSRAHVANQHQ